mgnify:CR=1 FL=1
MIDEKRALDLLATLGDPAGPAGYDVGRAIRDGRRRRTRTRLAVAAGSAAAVVAVIAGGFALVPARDAAPTPPAGLTPGPVHTLGPALTRITRCVSERLPGPDDAFVSAGDPTGTFLAGRAGGRVALWQDGKYTAVDAPGADPQVTGVNSRGVVIGNGQQEGGQPWAAAAGTVVPLPGPAGAVAAGIDEAGVVAGHRPQGAVEMPVIWDSVTAQPRDLPLPGGFVGGRALVVLPDGRIVGTAGTENVYRMQKAVVWTADHSRAEVLAGPGGRTAGVLAAADGWLLGNANGPARYEMATGEWTALTGDIGLQPLAINALGWVAGMDERDGRLFVHDGTRTRTPVRGAEALVVATFSDDGRVLGGSQAGKATRWTCS